jgi:hypothetical protein
MNEGNKLPSHYLDLINQIFEIEKKASVLAETNSIQRNINKLKDLLENEFVVTTAGERVGLTFINPIGEDYDETRTDCEASIAGDSTENLFISEVIKPVIMIRFGGRNRIVQKGIVIAKSKN